MKKHYLCLMFVLFTAMGVNAYAAGSATYNDTKDIVNPTGVGTVESIIITDVASDATTANIFYVDQAPSGSVLNSAAGFAMTKDAHNGTYYMTLRYDNDTTEQIQFTVKNNIKSDDVPMVMLDGSMEGGDNSNFSVAFVTNDLVDLSKYRTVKFAFTANGETRYLGYYLSGMQGKMPLSEINLGGHNGKVFLGVRLTEIENKYKTSSGGNVQMWLSKDSKFKEGGE